MDEIKQKLAKGRNSKSPLIQGKLLQCRNIMTLHDPRLWLYIELSSSAGKDTQGLDKPESRQYWEKTILRLIRINKFSNQPHTVIVKIKNNVGILPQLQYAEGTV